MNAPNDRFLEVIVYAVEVFSNPEKALRWLSSPRYELHGKTPISVIHEDKGYEEVMSMLVRIDHGVYS